MALVNSYSIAYNGLGGTGVPSATTGQYIGNAVSYYTVYLKGSSPSRTGYTFQGWGTSIGATSPSYQPSDSYSFEITGEPYTATLYAVWKAITYTVSYNKGANGSGTNTSDTKTYNVDLTLKTAIFTRTGYTQTGWSTSDGGSQAYALGATYSANAAVTLYPVWTINTYTITYKAGANGTGSQQTQTKTYGVNATLKGAIFTRTGYEQVGWSTTDGGTQSYALGGTYSTNSAVTLYPVWKATTSTFTVTSSVPADGSTQGTVTITRYSSSYTHKVVVSLGSRSQTFTNVATSQTFTIPTAWCDQMPSSTSKSGTVTVTTYSGSTSLGSNSKTFTVTVPSSVKPTVSLSGTNQSSNSTVSGWGILVQGFSTIKLTATASGGTGATVSDITFSGEGVSQTGTGTTTTSTLLNNAGSKTWKAVVTDSRGRKNTATLTRTVYEYYPASITAFTAKRSNSSGTAAPSDGTYINAKGTYSFASCNSHNSASVKKIEYKLHTASSWTSGVASATSGTAYTFGGGNISILSSYDVRMTVTDALGSTATYTVTVSSVDGVSFGLNGKCARFGGPVQYSDRFECDWNAQFDKVVDVVQRRADATLSSTGWYNIIKYNIGSSTSVKFAMAQILKIRMGTTYSGTNNCAHEVTMLATYNTNPRFSDELSRSNVNVIDKIRYRYDANNVGWIDVHYAASNSNDVWMMFDVSAYNTTQAYWISQNFVAVDDAPATGGTADVIISEHAFIATSGEKVTFTPTNGSSYSNYGGCWYSKSGDIVEVHVGVSGLTANTLTTVFTLPEGYRPKSIKCAMGQAGAVNNLSEMQIGTGGLVRVQSTSTYAMADITFICSI